ncbi:hypothetical protein QF000_000528 [Paraburkholderia atlantica]
MQDEECSPPAAAMKARERWQLRLALSIDPEET